MMRLVKKKIGNNYIVWFEKSNQWIQFEEPAWFVSKLYQKGIDNFTISLKCAKKYGLNKEESLLFVIEICKGIEKLSVQIPNIPIEVKTSAANYGNKHFDRYSTRYYVIAQKRVVIDYSSRLAEYYIHPPFAHLETSHFLGMPDVHYEIHNFDNTQVLREFGRPESALVYTDFMRLKKRLFINLVNVIYNKSNSDWMTFVHASALTDGKNTLLLSSDSGSGKSTMAALLQAHGLQLVSDDFVPIDVKTKRAFPFPAAISVKKGAFSFLSSYYEKLNDTIPKNLEYLGNSVRYLPPVLCGETETKARPVKGIVFIRYNSEVQCNFKLVPLVESLRLFHEQAWVSDNPEYAQGFINWFSKLSCYSLEYGNSEMGINVIMKVFNNQRGGDDEQDSNILFNK